MSYYFVADLEQVEIIDRFQTLGEQTNRAATLQSSLPESQSRYEIYGNGGSSCQRGNCANDDRQRTP